MIISAASLGLRAYKAYRTATAATADVYAVSNSPGVNGAEFEARLLHPQGISCVSVTDMVQQTLGRLGRRKLRKLCLFAHGQRGGTGIHFGSDVISIQQPYAYVSAMAVLKGYFDRSGFVLLSSCFAAQRPGIMLAVARTTGVPVWGFENDVNPVLFPSWNVAVYGGNMWVASPDGSFKRASTAQVKSIS